MKKTTLILTTFGNIWTKSNIHHENGHVYWFEGDDEFGVCFEDLIGFESEDL